MKFRLILFLTVSISICVACNKEKKNQCNPFWNVELNATQIPAEAQPSDSIFVGLYESLNADTDNTGDVLFYFDVPLIFVNPQGDVGKYVSIYPYFYYKLKDTLNPPRQVDLSAKSINECTIDFDPQYFSLVYDTIP